MDSPRQWPMFILLTVISFPLAPVWWWLCAGSARKDYWQNNLIRGGLLLVIASGVMPLAWALLGRLFFPDPTNNPIGIGLLYLLLTVAGLGLTLLGDVQVAERRNRLGEPV